MNNWTTSYYSKPLDGCGGYALLDPCHLGEHLPAFALWLVRQACGDWQQAQESAGTHLFFSVTGGAVILEIKAPTKLYEQFRLDPAYYEQLN